MSRLVQRSSPINIRALPAQRALIDKAAACSNRSRSDFMLESACKEAENVLLNQRLFFVDESTYQAFTTLLEAPVSENLALQALLNKKAPWEK